MGVYTNKSLVMNKDPTVSKIHYINTSGPWPLILQTHKSGVKDWSINAWAGNKFCFNPAEARNIILGQDDEATYKEWKRFVMACYEDDVTALLKDASRVMGRWNAWSVTCDDSSTRLMKRTPGIVTINPGVSFLYH
jgi:hypothetical protein